MRRVIWVISALALVLAGCGDDGSVFDGYADSTSSTGPADSSITTTSAGSGESGDGESGPDLLPPDPSTIIQTATWGEVYDRRLVVALADGVGPGAAEEVAAAVGGTVVVRLDEYLIAEIELASAGEAALAAALETLAGHPAVVAAAPSGVVHTDREVSPAPCGPLDSLVLQAEERGDQYSLIGAEDAWRLVRASGVTATRPTIGIVDGFGSSTGYHGAWVDRVIHSPTPGDAPGVFDAILGEEAVTIAAREVFGTSGTTSSTAWMAGARRTLAQGATVVNLSLGGAHSPEQQAVIRRWLQLMAIAHPEVLFVASAGNAGGDVADHFPGGISEPNLVTVGGLNHQGDRAEFSNFVNAGGEVTLSVIAENVFTGMTSDGAPATMNGTSFAAPQVTAAVAVLQALDPALTGAEIKQILIDTAATDIANPDISDRIIEVDPALGGRVLRVDNAVWKVLSERLGVTGTREDLLGRATLTARVRLANDDPLTYVIRAVAPGGADAATVQIAVNGPGVLNPGSESLTTDDDVARWRWSFLTFGVSAQVTLTRTDTGACARVVITADETLPTYAGEYQGTFDWAFPEAGFAAAVPFTATVADDGTISLVYGWSGSYSPAEGVTIDISVEGSCEGTVDDQGVVACTGDFMGHTSWAGWADNPGVCSVDAVIDPDGNLTGAISASSDLGGEGSFPLRGTRIGG